MGSAEAHPNPSRKREGLTQMKNWLIHSAIKAGLSSPSISSVYSTVC